MKLLLKVRVIGSLLALAVSVSAVAAPAPIVVCYPGGPVSESEANTAMGAMLRVVERVGEWPANSFTSYFTAQADECRSLLNSKKPRLPLPRWDCFLNSARPTIFCRWSSHG